MVELKEKIPQSKIPYLVESGEGERYIFGRQLATVIASPKSTGNLFELVILSGGKGDKFLKHIHEQTHESIYVLNGRIELNIDDQHYLLNPGDYAFIPAGTVHGYIMQSHHTRFLSFTMKDEVGKIYSIIGEPYDKYVHPPKPYNEFMNEKLEKAALQADIKVVGDINRIENPIAVTNTKVPDGVVPYVLESGSGIGLVTGDQLHSLLTTQENSNGEFISVVSEGPKGERIPEHYHEKHSETFICIEGKMTMWANGEELQLYPGDFLHVPANTIHAYRIDSHYTKFLGFLSPGLFEPFFRTLGDPYEDHIFPSEPRPLRFDRVLARLHELDLKVVGGPPASDNGKKA
jgi:quercetin 2,3-dioxygenase